MQSEKIKKTKSVLRKLFIGIAAAILVTILFFAIISHNDNSQQPVLRINDQELYIEIAKSSQDKLRGLCCRDSLPEDQGMLFLYDQPGNYGFWMKDTRIPLDMYWINTEKKIVHIEHAVQPDSYPDRFHSPVPAQYVLETNAGYAKRHSIKVGDLVSF